MIILIQRIPRPARLRLRDIARPVIDTQQHGAARAFQNQLRIFAFIRGSIHPNHVRLETRLKPRVESALRALIAGAFFKIHEAYHVESEGVERRAKLLLSCVHTTARGRNSCASRR